MSSFDNTTFNANDFTVPKGLIIDEKNNNMVLGASNSLNILPNIDKKRSLYENSTSEIFANPLNRHIDDVMVFPAGGGGGLVPMRPNLENIFNILIFEARKKNLRPLTIP